MTIKSSLKQISKYILLSLLFITVPLSFQPTIAGALFAHFHDQKVKDGIKAYAAELDSLSWIMQYSIPGAKSILEHLDNASPFFVDQLRHAHWGEKLGMTQPYLRDFGDETPVDRFASFEGVMRDTSCHRNHPNSYWVYVTNLAMPEIFSWDAAFVRLLEHHDMHPPADNAGFAYVDCTASPFVCNVWQVDYPALVHFLVRDESPDPSEINPDAFDAEPKDLRQVDVRIFDLGLQQNSTTLSPGVFPTEFEQMRSLTANEGAYTVEEPYDELGREYHRFHNLYYTPACNLQGSFLDYSSELDNFIFKKIMKPIGLEYAADIYAGIAFLCSLNLAFIGLWIYRTIEDFFSSFLGRPTEFDELAQRMEERQDFADSGGFMGDMMQHFIDGIEAAFEANQSATGVPGEVTAAADARKAMFAGLRTNMSSVLAQG